MTVPRDEIHRGVDVYPGDSYLFAAVRSRSATVTTGRQPDRVMEEHDLRHVECTPDLYDERTFTELVEGVAYARNTGHRGRSTARVARGTHTVGVAP